MIYFVKFWIDHSITNISTTREIEFFSFFQCFEFFECVFNPLCLGTIRYHTRRDKIAYFILQMWMGKPFFSKIFIRFTTKNFVFHNQKNMLQDMIFEEIVKIKVIPRAKKTEIIGTMDDGTLKIRIKAVPEN